MAKSMILSRGFWRSTIVAARNVKRVTPEIIECDCPECLGTGDWSQFMPEPTEERVDCVECKGTGRIYA
jgi:hypothetical protein